MSINWPHTEVTTFIKPGRMGSCGEVAGFFKPRLNDDCSQARHMQFGLPSSL